MTDLKTLQIEGMTARDLIQSFEEIVKSINQAADKRHEATVNPVWLTRQQVADMFGVSLPTVHAWTNAGLLISYKIGNRTMYKYSEVMETPKAMKYSLSND